jgi:hypothetical protein
VAQRCLAARAVHDDAATIPPTKPSKKKNLKTPNTPTNTVKNVAGKNQTQGSTETQTQASAQASPQVSGVTPNPTPPQGHGVTNANTNAIKIISNIVSAARGLESGQSILLKSSDNYDIELLKLDNSYILSIRLSGKFKPLSFKLNGDIYSTITNLHDAVEWLYSVKQLIADIETQLTGKSKYKRKEMQGLLDDI